MGSDGYCYGVNISDGSLAWKSECRAAESLHYEWGFAVKLDDDGTVWFLSGKGYAWPAHGLWGVSCEDGTIKHQIEAPLNIWRLLAVADSKLYVECRTPEEKMVVLSADTGKVLWTGEPARACWASDDSVACSGVSNSSWYSYILDTDGVSVKWNRIFPGRHPVILGNEMFLFADPGIVCVELDTFKVKWQSENVWNRIGNAFVNDDTVFARAANTSQGRYELWAFDRATGKTRWNKKDALNIPFAATNTTLYAFHAVEGRLYGHDSHMHGKRWEAEIPDFGEPIEDAGVLAAGIVYVADEKSGNLWAIE